MASGEGDISDAKDVSRVLIPDLRYYSDLVPCAAHCPVHTDAGSYVRNIALGNDSEAFRHASAPNPLVSVCGRVCAHPCESACRRGRIDEPVSIRALKRFVTERFGVESALGPLRSSGLLHLVTSQSAAPPARGKKVAVIGGGPAGIACARDLSRLGYGVVLFDSAPELGGMVRLGIPEYRMPRDILQLEIQAIIAGGVDVRTRTRLGKEITLDGLLGDGFDALFLAYGATRSRDLSIPGIELDGVMNGVEFLLNVNLGYRVSIGRRVIVVGGGNVAVDVARVTLRAESESVEPEAGGGNIGSDAARAALRLGAREVHMVFLESLEEMPAFEEEIREAREEGIVLHPRRGPMAIHGAGGRAQALETLECTSVFDSTGRFNPHFRENSQELLEADTVILAIGQQPDPAAIPDDLGIEKAGPGYIKVNPESLATSRAGVWAGGDLAFGPRTVIEAVSDGRRAARSIHEFLEGGMQSRLKYTFVSARELCPPSDGLEQPRVPIPIQPIGRRTGFREVDLGYSEAEARREANRCLRCHINTVFDSSKCILCGGCIDVCPEYCLRIVPASHLEDLPVSLTEPGFRLGRETEEQPSGVILKDEDRCIRCALCADRCPVGAITMEALSWTEEENGDGQA